MNKKGGGNPLFQLNVLSETWPHRGGLVHYSINKSYKTKFQLVVGDITDRVHRNHTVSFYKGLCKSLIFHHKCDFKYANDLEKTRKDKHK